MCQRFSGFTRRTERHKGNHSDKTLTKTTCQFVSATGLRFRNVGRIRCLIERLFFGRSRAALTCKRLCFSGKAGDHHSTTQCVETSPRNRKTNGKTKKFSIERHLVWWYVLKCLKPPYGLNDAPVTWQLVLSDYLVQERKANCLIN